MEEEFNLKESLEGITAKMISWLDSIILNLPNFLLAIVTFIVFIFVAKYAGQLLNRLLSHRVKQDSIRHITVKVTKIVVILIGFFIALGILDLNKILTSVLAGAGVIGLAIGLALQGTLNNTFSGIILSFLPQLQIGDWIETNDYAGEVTEISLRNIVIKQSDNNYVIIPNSKIVELPFKNFSRTKRSRVMLNCGVAYSSNLERVKEMTIETISEHFPARGNEEVEFMFTEFGDSSINFVVRFWIDATKNKDFLIAKDIAIIEIKKTFDKNGINIPFPIRTIDFSNTLNMKKPE
ncbi:mechanosensitive ion channel [Salegentibacter sp. JZCK2]|uniref:mechanosensitive ion channel family protein n=1 Tax=Salegentibacter tibetensis TaxID=2873600 RepID=UPI001CCE6DB7|nr:mechanosensitive ion channel [Salegentibacter tibetensis]MBZ9729102.1 mechanosensitive ion channel [Salegentibacter tibetensis]